LKTGRRICSGRVDKPKGFDFSGPSVERSC